MDDVLQLLRAPCKINLSLKVKQFERPRERSEAWLYIGQHAEVSEASTLDRYRVWVKFDIIT